MALLTPREVAARLNVCERTVSKWIREGRIPAIHINQRVIRLDWEAVLQALSAPTDQPGGSEK